MTDLTSRTDLGSTPGLSALGAMPAWLTAAADPEVVAAAMVDAVPELVDGRLILVACAPKLRQKDGPVPGWAASYRITVADGGEDGPRRKVELVGTFEPSRIDEAPATVSGDFGEPGWRCQLPALGLDLGVGRTDDALPTLPMLTDPATAGPLLEASLRRAYPDVRVTGCRPEVMRHKPGSRCTLRYELDVEPAEGPPSTVVAKTYRGDKGANAFAGMDALWRTDIASGAVVSLAEPIDYRPDLKLLVQGPVQEDRTLKDLVRSCFAGDGFERPDQLELVAAELAKTADGLAALHGSGVDHGDIVTWGEELDDARNLIERLRPSLPDLAATTTAFLDRLEAPAAGSAPEPAAPCHRSFRPAQVLLHQGRIAFIDFDGLAMAEPALDVALFRAAVRDVGAGALLAAGAGPDRVEAGLDALDRLCDGFLDRYRTRRPVAVERVRLWETLDLLTYVLHCWTKIKPERLPTRMTLLDRHLARNDVD